MKYSILIFVLQFIVLVGFAQQSQRYFGKNRIQYKEFKWEFLSTQNFDIYFYYGGREAAIYASKYAEIELPNVMEILGYAFFDNIIMLVYNTHQDFLQSNLGNIEPHPAVGGVTNFVKPKIEVVFDGKHAQFRANIKKEIAKYMLRETFYGGTIKEIVQNSYLLSLPNWYIDGLAEYVAYGWNREMDNYIRNLLLTDKVKNPNVLVGQDATLVGQSIWNFIAMQYGKNNISTIVHLTAITRNHHQAIENALNMDIKDFYKEWKYYYTKMADNLPLEYGLPENAIKLTSSNKKGKVFTDIAISTTGEYVVYGQNYKGKTKVVLHFLSNQKKRKKVLYRKGYFTLDQQPDYSKPLVSCGGDVIGVISKKRNKFYLYTYFSNGKKDKKTLIPGFENILDFDFSNDGNAIVFSAQVNGQSDIHYYNFKDNTYRQLTADFNDDLHPRFLNDPSSVVFISNRKQDTLIPTRVYPEKIKIKDYNENYDLFIYPNIKGSTNLVQLIKSPDQESYPNRIGKNAILYLSDEGGINQLYYFDLDQKKQYKLTKFHTDIKNYAYFSGTNTLVIITLNKGKECIYLINNFNPKEHAKEYTLDVFETDWYKEHEFKRILEFDKQTKESEIESKSDSSASFDSFSEEIDVDNYLFEAEKKLVQNTENFNNQPIKRKTKYLYQTRQITEDMVKRAGPFPYKRQLSIENIVASVNVENLRGLGFYNEGSLIDIVGNNRFKAGALIFNDLRSSDMFGEYQFLKYRIDFTFRVDKKRYFVIKDNSGLPIWHKNGLNSVEAQVSYPFTNAFKAYVTPTYLNVFFKQMYPGFLAISQDKDYHLGGVKVGANYDNTSMYGVNMIEGTRYAILYENYKGINVKNQDFGRLDVDFRKYQRIHRELLFAFRGAAGIFLGKAKKSFMLGGMDNWLNRNADLEGEGNPLAKNTSQDIILEGNTDIFLNQFVTNMRGFRFNSLYGDKYFLLNSEIRWPIIKHLFGKRPLTSSFFRNLQIISFFDVGSAWSGKSPFDKNNNYNRQFFFQDNTFSGVVQTFRSPILTSYGLGLRSYLLGYYLKVDAARGIRDYFFQPWMFHLTLGHDF